MPGTGAAEPGLDGPASLKPQVEGLQPLFQRGGWPPDDLVVGRFLLIVDHFQAVFENGWTCRGPKSRFSGSREVRDNSASLHRADPPGKLALGSYPRSTAGVRIALSDTFPATVLAVVIASALRAFYIKRTNVWRPAA